MAINQLQNKSSLPSSHIALQINKVFTLFSTNNHIYWVGMIQEHISRIVQSLVALPLLILTISHWNQNRIGQNMMNLSSTAVYVIGLEYIVIAWRWLMGFQENCHYELTIAFGSLFFLSKLFEKFHPSDNGTPFNKVCEYNLEIILGANILFVLLLLLLIFAYACRQIYRLMTETLLSASQNLEDGERNQIMALHKPFAEVRKGYAQVSGTCSICLMEFERDNSCILLPGCEHCFHTECIEGWIQNHSTCPYCRNNLRLSLI